MHREAKKNIVDPKWSLLRKFDASVSNLNFVIDVFHQIEVLPLVTPLPRNCIVYGSFPCREVSYSRECGRCRTGFK